MARNYRVLIDQSGKAEDYDTDTAIAYSSTSNDSFPARAVKIRREQKSLVRKDANRLIDSKKKIHIKMFCAGIYMSTKPNINKINKIVVDQEYEGNEGLVKNYLYNFYQNFSIWIKNKYLV